MPDLAVSYLVDDAALKIGDPNKTRVKLSEWTLFYNQSTRELCEKADVLQFCSKFDLSTERRFTYPVEMTQMTRVAVSETPSDADSFRYLDEMFEDEWRHATYGNYPTSSIPTHYFSEAFGFYLYPRASAAIVDGMEITYYGIPDRVFDTTGNYQLPHFTQDYVIRRMVIYAKMARNRVVEAEAELKQWYADIEGLQDRMDDRSKDRRSSLRPRRPMYHGMR